MTLKATLESALIGQATKAEVIAACDEELDRTRKDNPMKPQGIFKNGDLWFGGKYQEEGKWWYGANTITSDPDKGVDYETEEMPETFPLFAMTIFPNGTHELFVTEYMLAKKIGEQRFGSACQHARAKRGYCPDCLRKVHA